MESFTSETATDKSGNVFELRPAQCPTCQVADFDFMGFRGGTHHRYGLGIVSRIVRCRRCRLLLADPFPHPRDAQRLYGDPDKYFASHDTARKVEGYRAMIAELIKLVDQPKPSVLDVGSGRGEALYAAKGLGLEAVTGLDFSEAMRKWAAENYGVTIRTESIEDHANGNGQAYDIILMMAVLEHVYDPDSMIAAAAKLSREGSVIMINVPQEPSLMTIVGNIPGQLTRSRTVLNLSPSFPPYHLFGFNTTALTALLRKHGFEPFRWQRVSSVRVPSQGGLTDRLRSVVATQVNRLGNLTGLSHDMSVWARRQSS